MACKGYDEKLDVILYTPASSKAQTALRNSATEVAYIGTFWELLIPTTSRASRTSDRDWTRVVRDHYTSDGVLMAPGFQPAVGSEALEASYDRTFSTIKLDINFSIDEIVVMDGGWAFARTTAEGRKYWLQKGTDEFHHNQEIFICRKVEGSWKIARYCFSSMKPVV